MPPRQATAEPQPPATPPEPPKESGPDKPVDDRLSSIEQRQDRQEGLLQQILDRLPGKTPSSGSSSGAVPAAPDPDEGKPIAQLVQEGVERLEREKAAKTQKETEAAERADHAARLKKLEESAPREVAATPAGRVRAAVQRYGFGIEDTRR